MRLTNACCVLAIAAAGGSTVHGFQLASSPRACSSMKVSATMNVDEVAAETTSPNGSSMTYAEVNKLAFRALQKECKSLGLSAMGTTAALRGRLVDHFGLAREEKAVAVELPKATAAEIEELCATEGITFCDESDPDFDFKSVLSEVIQKSSMGHWKGATRKLKKLTKQFSTPDNPVPRDAYVAVLEACAANRLNGARASEPARRILEDMATFGYEIPADLANVCVVSSLGDGPGGTHDDCGGIDAALAMVAAIESSPGGADVLTDASYGRLVSALAKDGAVEEAELVLRSMVVEKSFTPPLSTFADVAKAAAKTDDRVEDTLQVLSYAKAAGYELDSIAAVETGRDLLASGVIAAEKMDNLALGLRLLTAAAKAQGCAPDSGDDLVASSSSAAQRACTLIHKRAIDKACEDSNWKLAVKLLELMPKRSLTPATSVWRRVLSTCCKNEKSRKATAILLDWVTLANEGKAVKPPVSVFNTVVNTCEVCGEEELTVKVLDIMRDTLETEGNIITFNIALKRLAKMGNVLGCEAILIGMLKEGLEPNVVSYTTTIGACAKKGSQNAAAASMWLQRMRTREIQPNYHTYNTALAACLDGKLESTFVGAKIATEMVEDAEKEIACGLKGSANFKSALPDSYTKVLARQLMKQLRENWRSGDIDMALAKSTTRVPLLKLVDFEKKLADARLAEIQCDVEEDEVEENAEQDYEFTLLKDLHKDDHRTAMV
mmetsp:Transcript_47895/g.101776  ORF Transcript_47895/g.101776 Transcript_47895/m.101776 type:complete len:723 (-) Transcript_47895:168-2336(-)|eukprot:CAMPEP_0172526184 /NCGR_PEP_ID=MMETSP1067-20121228/1144_1 /TAXON_ID=265564 ORGANISM="Thalassiosira punctigera, Strain Tpunct2005C2" /NCGR_SAMPLE_ID=MMETSP1067 /ASSEMBLY_ACC=CAM_ASM_000444 /LENGTH=722 /DNA_ID=CAMNT_0013309633 /DNA_START=267 /DNA_END=2435 /DNA_ORIENTATION=-